MSSKSMALRLKQAKPYIAVILMQFGNAGMSIIIKFAMNKGMSQHVLVVYRHAVATLLIAPFALLLERKTRPKMTYAVFTKIVVLGLLEPVIDQNLFYSGMKFTTATFAAAMSNVLPAFVFILAWIVRLEKVDIRRFRSQAKVVGTVVTVGGAMFMSMFDGPALNLPWTRHKLHHESGKGNNEISMKGAVMISSGCVSWSSFIILQAITLKSYPAELSLTALICLMGALEGSVVAIALEWGNPSAWALKMDSMVFAALYSGIVCSGIAYYIQGLVMKDKGPVFVTAFNPLGMVIVAVFSSFLLAETMYWGRVIGGAIIVVGLYLVLWAKSKDDAPSESETSKKLSSPTPDEHQNLHSVSINTELSAINGAKVRSGDESV